MELVYNFSFLECQGCHARINCDKCEEKVKSSLLQKTGFEDVNVNMVSKQIRVKVSHDDEDAVLDTLELIGVFAD